MRIDTLYVEHSTAAYPLAAQIESRLQPVRIEHIDDHQDFFSRKRTPYLEKRNTRNVFIATKRGAVVREAPAAYGYASGDPHYYHIHAYNCVYECQYCYLQGYFSSPDLVFFVNHDTILSAMREAVGRHAGQHVWFHAGEFSDSLALSHITGELPVYWDFFSKHPHASLELRTKSINLTELRKLQPLRNVIVSFSLSSEVQAEEFDLGAPSVSQRIAAIKRLSEAGFKLAVHFDPIIYHGNFEIAFASIVHELSEQVSLEAFEYFSVGAVRFAKDVFREARQNYPDSGMFARMFIQGEDQKMRYVRPMRLALLETARDILKKHGCPEEKIYFCME